MRIVSLRGNRAMAETLGVRREIALGLLEEPWPQAGEYVMVHVGYAISRVDAVTAEAAWAEWSRLQDGGHA